MNIQFKNSDGRIAGRLQERIERRLAKLSRLTDSEKNAANTFFEIERAVGSHQTGEVWQATINIDADGTRFHASELAETPEKAANKAMKEIETEVRRARGKERALLKRGGGFFKSLTRRFA